MSLARPCGRGIWGLRGRGLLWTLELGELPEWPVEIETEIEIGKPEVQGAGGSNRRLGGVLSDPAAGLEAEFDFDFDGDFDFDFGRARILKAARRGAGRARKC